jgi:hypothetical protein
MNNKHLEELIYRADMVRQDVRDEFGNLSTFQLNWKPSPEQWSIAQCLHHIIVADEAYLSDLDKILNGKYTRPLWSLVPGKSAFWGKLLLSLMKSDSGKKLQTPAIFEPSSIKLTDEILSDFESHEQRVSDYLRKLDGVKNSNFYLKSPVSPYITYSLRDLEEVMVLHHERHFRQALQVSRLDKFPKSEKLNKSDDLNS